MPLASWRRLTAILQMIRLIGLLLRVAYEAYGFQFFPHGTGVQFGCAYSCYLVEMDNYTPGHTFGSTKSTHSCLIIYYL
ncbi:hypothetical protein C2S53_020601 [Perilla frutescens var. hirtella]|uniref:Secreted protein n=1 Tax=Perilla frutescens var. hirtella TaxID=608512 RepID=A0AAD4NZB0_PERFH|nr:hypothetical protein C2S53_020601 [Perilla frutescens var. hirtella]